MQRQSIQRRHLLRRLGRVGAAAAALAFLCGTSTAQYAERSGLVGSGRPDVDASGRSIKNKRVRAVHTTNVNKLGGTRYFFEKDPFLAYQLGRNLNFREFRLRDGVLDDTLISNLAGPMPDGNTAKITANNQMSCTACHNQPYGTVGGGMNFAKDSGLGRNSPHYFGGGIMEMLGIQIRTEIIAQLDTDDSGWVSVAEAQAFVGNVMVEPSPGATLIDFGDPHLTTGTTGAPSFDPIIRVWYVDSLGREVPGATRIDGVNTVGYNLEVATFGWGQALAGGIHGSFPAVNPTLRAFYWDPHNAHSGLQAYDPTTTNDPDHDGISEPSLAGAIQFPTTHRPPDLGYFQHPSGFSTTDPDDDGYLNEISEGDLDLAEWFMLNAPRPAFRGNQTEFDAGVALMDQMSCTSCHVANWTIRAADADYAGDRRFIDFDVTWNATLGRWQGTLVKLYTQVGDSYVRDFGSFEVEGFFSDMRQHDMGVGFRELGYDGVYNKVWRTAPLWGVGSGFPWGHDGASLTLHDAILRHDGEGAASKAAYLAATDADRDALIAFLEKLELYDVEAIRADINGDHSSSDNFFVGGIDTGPERFNAEWLFKVPLLIQGMVLNAEGEMIRSFAGTNVKDAYGELLPYRIDSDSDGWPDVWDIAPNFTGYKDGIKN